MTKYVSCGYDSLLGGCVEHFTEVEFRQIWGEYINVCLYVFQETKTARVLNINIIVKRLTAEIILQ